MSNFGQGLSAVAGAVIGFFIPGVGPVAGFQIGLLAGSALFPTQLPGVQGPRLEDFETAQADPGAPVFQVYGTAHVPGFRMYLGPVLQTSTTEDVGGKGPPEQEVTTFHYFQTLAVGLCEGPISGVRRIWENGELVYDPRPQQEGEAFEDYASRLSMSEEYEQTFTLYLGDEEQLADPTLELEKGAGTVPGFRGLAYIVYPDRELQQDQALRHPMFKVEVIGHGDIPSCNLAIEELATVDAWAATGDPLTRSAIVDDEEIVQQDAVSNADGTFTRSVRRIGLDGGQLSTTSTEHPTIDGHADVSIANVQNSSTIQAMRKNGAGTGNDVSAWFLDGGIGASPIKPPVSTNHLYTFASDVIVPSRLLFVPNVGVYAIGGNDDVGLGTVETWIARYPMVGAGPSSQPNAFRVIQNVSPVDALVGIAGYDQQGRVYVYRKGEVDGSGTAYYILRLAGDLTTELAALEMPPGVADNDSIRIVCGRYVTLAPGSFSVAPINLPNNPLNVADLVLTDSSSTEVSFTNSGAMTLRDSTHDGSESEEDMWLLNHPNGAEAAKYQARAVLLDFNETNPEVGFQDTIATEQPDGIWRGFNQIFRFTETDGQSPFDATGNALVRFEFRRFSDLKLMGRFTCQFNMTT